MRSSKLKDKLSLILYEHKTPPRYFEMNKGMMKFLFLGLPALSAVLAVAGIIFIARWNSYRTTELPKEVLEVNRKLAKVERERDHLQKNNEELLKRISSSDNASSSDLSLFTTPKGQQDLTSDKYFETTDIKSSLSNGKLNLSFNLVNITPGNKRVSGHFIVMMKGASDIQFFPKALLEGDSQKVSYTSGEPFATSRFRPVKAEFHIHDNMKNAHFRVYVFSRVGDILYIDDFKRDF